MNKLAMVEIVYVFDDIDSPSNKLISETESPILDYSLGIQAGIYLEMLIIFNLFIMAEQHFVLYKNSPKHFYQYQFSQI